MSEGPPNFNPFESAGNSDSPEKKPSKSKKKSIESKPAKQEKAVALPEASKEKKQGVLDKLFGKEVSSSENDHPAEAKEDRTAKPELTDKEATDALGRMVDARELEVGASELHGANADAAETSEAEADVKLLQHIKQEAAKEGATVAEALANAEQQTLEALGLGAAESTEHSEGAEGAEEAASAEGMSAEDETAETTSDATDETIIDPHEISEAEIPLNAEDDPEPSQQSTGSHGGGAGGVPPHDPGGSSGSPSGGGGSGMGGGTGGPRRPFVSPGYNPNLHNVPASGTTEYIYHESNALGAALLGGIVGYLLGKRRGRIKTEKRLVPVQKKLEREVRDIHTQLLDSEMRIRHLMAEKVRAGALRNSGERPVASSEKSSAVRGAPVPERQQPSKLETRLGLQKPAQAERLGKVLVRAEAAKRNETIIELNNITPEHVRTMNRQELLALSEKVIVEGASLRQMYESHLIGERGLRRIITEHLEGRDVQKQLRREMVEREIDFERDPILRDKAYQEVSTRSASQPLQQLLQKAGINTEEDSNVPDIQRQERYEAAVRKAEKQRRMADSAMITVIIVLASLVAILFINR